MKIPNKLALISAISLTLVSFSSSCFSDIYVLQIPSGVNIQTNPNISSQVQNFGKITDEAFTRAEATMEAIRLGRKNATALQQQQLVELQRYQTQQIEIDSTTKHRQQVRTCISHNISNNLSLPCY